MLVNGTVCYIPEWGGSTRNGVLVNGMECYIPEWGVSIWDEVFV